MPLSLPCDLLLRHFESMQEPFICHDLLPCVPKCVQRFFHILGIVVFVVGQLAEEHLIDKAIPGLVLCNGGFPLFLKPAEGITDKPRISSQIETACISKPVNFVEVFLRVKAPGIHHLPKLLLSKRIADWEYVDFLLMLLEKFPILVHDLVSSTFR